MSIRERLSGNEAIATAMRQIDPDVFAAFPITPSTEIPQYFAQYVAAGKVGTAYVTVESEPSSMSARRFSTIASVGNFVVTSPSATPLLRIARSSIILSSIATSGPMSMPFFCAVRVRNSSSFSG